MRAFAHRPARLLAGGLVALAPVFVLLAAPAAAHGGGGSGNPSEHGGGSHRNSHDQGGGSSGNPYGHGDEPHGNPNEHGDAHPPGDGCRRSRSRDCISATVTTTPTTPTTTPAPQPPPAAPPPTSPPPTIPAPTRAGPGVAGTAASGARIGNVLPASGGGGTEPGPTSNAAAPALVESLGGAPASRPTTAPKRRPARFQFPIDPGAATVPVGVAVGLGIAGLATGFVVALGVLGRLGPRARRVG